MNKTATCDVRAIRRIAHDEAMQIAALENGRFGAQLRGFDEADWTKPTDCTRWDVHALASHVVGAAAGQASPREFVRQVRKGRPLVPEAGEFWWDGMNELQVRERARLRGNELIDEWETNSRRALRARTRLPRPIGRLPLLNLPAPLGRQPVSYLFDTGFTRDVWMHRIDLARATGKALEIDHEHDGRIVADIVAEWAGTHGQPFTLDLEGPAGGGFAAGSDGEYVKMDAIEFCRILAERAHGDGILSHPLPL
jgi:uncharacterized protein (TIGR03083 family)